MYPEHGTNLQDILMNADAAMLTSKYQGRNTSSVFNYDLELLETKSQSKLINDLGAVVDKVKYPSNPTVFRAVVLDSHS